MWLMGDDILEELSGYSNVQFDKKSKGKQKRGLIFDSSMKKRSIFFQLPYWRRILVRYNLDVMHCEKIYLREHSRHFV